MALIFPKNIDLFVKIGGGVVGLLALGGLVGFTYFSYPTVLDTGYSPEQPVKYSHKLHVGQLGMDCYYCHSTIERSSYAAIPATQTCMNCHVRVKPQSKRLETLRTTYEKGESMKWVKIHVLPDYVYFNHSAHLNAGVSCVSCHGRIDQMVEVKQAQPLNMAWCLDCHRNPAKNIRPAELVTKLDWKPDRDPAEIGMEIIRAKNIHPPTNCSGCHR